MAIHHHAHCDEELCAEIDALGEQISMQLEAVVMSHHCPGCRCMELLAVPEHGSDEDEIDAAIDEHEHGTHDHEERAETDEQIEDALAEHREEDHGEHESTHEAGDTEDDAVVVSVDDGLPDIEEQHHEDEAHSVPFGRG